MQRAIFRIPLASAAVSLTSLLLTTSWLRYVGQGATLLDVDILRLMRRIAERSGFQNALLYLPDIFRAWFPLDQLSDLCRFVAVAAPISLLAYAVLALALLLGSALVQRATSRSEARDEARPESSDASFAAILAVLLFPAAWVLISEIAPALGAAARILAATVACLLLGLALWRIGPRPARLELGLMALLVAAGGANAAALFVALLSPDARFAAPVDASPGAPNLLLISIDSLRADHLGVYGYERDTSPTIDRLAAEGMRFDRAFAPSSWTLPSHATLLTGLPPERHGVNQDSLRLSSEVATLAERLRKAGYATSAFVSGPYLSATYGFPQGFNLYDQTSAQPNDALSHRAITSPPLYRSVVAWLDAWQDANAPRPFFVFLHMWDVHYDFIPPAPFDTLFDPEYNGSFRGHIEHMSELPARDREHMIALYDGEIRFTDSYIGKLIEQLEERGILDDTLIVVTSDHGEEFYEHGSFGHRQTLYEESIHVPLVIRWPGHVPEGRVIDHTIGLGSIVPLLCSMLGVEVGEGEFEVDGDDLRALVEGAPVDGDLTELVFGELHGESAYVRTRDWKLITSKSEDDQLYEVEDDAAEQSNVISEFGAVAEELRARGQEYRERWGASGDLAEPTEVDTKLEENLRALGYVE